MSQVRRSEPAWAGDEPAYAAAHREALERHEGRDVDDVIRLKAMYAHGVPNAEAIDTLAALSPLLEVGAGGGYWSRLLRDRGVDVIAIDISPPATTWTEVERGDARIAAAHPERTLFMCWPYRPDYSPAAEALDAFRGLRLALVTDGRSIAFGEELADPLYDRLDDEWALTSIVAIPTWFGLRDDLRVYERR